MEAATSSDGTRIAFDRGGEGPPLVLVHGSTADRSRWAVVRPALDRRFTTLAMDRRGRGDSGDGDSYDIAREYDDVAAVVAAAGDGVSLLGHSFGALCAMEAALRAGNLRRLVLYEPVFPVGGLPLYPPAMPGRLRKVLQDEGREAFLVAFFREAVGMDDAQIDKMRADPSWKGRLASAHTALRELADGDYRFEPARFRGLTVPTLLLVGEISPGEMTRPAHALHDALPDSRLVVMAGQGHVAMTTAPELFLREVTAFLAS